MKYLTFKKSLAAEKSVNAKNFTTVLRIQELQKTAGPLKTKPTEIKIHSFHQPKKAAEGPKIPGIILLTEIELSDMFVNQGVLQHN